MNARIHSKIGTFATGIVGLALSLGVMAQEAPARGPLPFSAHDQNGDGSVSEPEFAAVRARQEAKGWPMHRAQSFAALDANRDGRLSTEEFAAGLRPAQSGMRGGAIPAPTGVARGKMPAFAEFDRDADGRMTEQEFNDARTERIKARAEQGRMMRGMADGHTFADLDANHDSTVSPEEFAAHQAAQRTKMGQ